MAKAPKNMTHNYYYQIPAIDQALGHIKLKGQDRFICGYTIKDLEGEKRHNVAKYKRFIPDRDICPDCQKRFKKYLETMYPILNGWGDK